MNPIPLLILVIVVYGFYRVMKLKNELVRYHQKTNPPDYKMYFPFWSVYKQRRDEQNQKDSRFE